MSDSDTLPPSKKRQRKNSNEEQITRSSYWFADGNVVLKAENTLFRVHQSILSRHSQIFKDTFAMPQVPSQEDEHIEGCPVVPLADTAEDVGNIISLLYDHDMTLKFGSKLPARVLGSMLRLGRKYFIDYLQQEALDRLYNDYPTTLEEWDSYTNRQIKDSESELSTTKEIISIAHEFHIPTILPAAYVQYLQYQDLESILGDTGIPEKAQERCMIGNTRILGYVKNRAMEALCRPMVIPSKACSSSGKCQASRSKTIKTLPIWSTEECAAFGIFDCEMGETETLLCLQCRAELIKFTIQVRTEFWSILPTFFGLSAWANLKDDIGDLTFPSPGSD